MYWKTSPPPHSHPMPSCLLLPRGDQFCEFLTCPPSVALCKYKNICWFPPLYFFTQMVVITILTILLLAFTFNKKSWSSSTQFTDVPSFHSCIVFPSIAVPWLIELTHYTGKYGLLLQRRLWWITLNTCYFYVCRISCREKCMKWYCWIKG